MKTRLEITNYSREEDKSALLWLLDNYHWASQWQFVATCTFQTNRTGSAERIRVWSPTKEGRVLYAHREEL